MYINLSILDITRKNFGLIHVFSCTQCFVLHIVHSSARTHEYFVKKIAVGEGWGNLSGGIQLVVDLKIAEGKKC